MRAPAETLRLPVLCLLAEGHALIEDFPGVGKTVLAKSLSRSLDLSFSRIQFTPDLLPSDVTGVNVFDQRTGEFAFRPGPVFANVILVDEVNRPPRRRSRRLEAMQETQVTIDGETHLLARPFLVLATQNPVEYEDVPAARSSARPLLGADGDRLSAAARRSAHAGRADDRVAARDPAAGGRRRGRAPCDRRRAGVFVEETVNRYVVALLRHTRANARLALGASPRAGIRARPVAKPARSRSAGTTCSPRTSSRLPSWCSRTA